MSEQAEFQLEMTVRDYECDMQGIVNNGVYQNYLEHARHEFLKEIGIDFVDYTQRGINLVVIRAELDYKLPLSGGDRFKVTVKLEQESRARFAFHQQIIRLSDDRLSLKAK
ncbi:MAG: acyl-CoA thioesterase, partial [Motiliproteus sp.]|nr:acyl-CoA thioesterase [Motiliproteus sp.]